MQRVQNLISSPSTEIQARQVVAAIEGLVLNGGAFLLAIVAIVLEASYVKVQPVPAYVHVPAETLSQGYNIAGATITVVSVDTFVEFTITAQPTPTGLTG